MAVLRGGAAVVIGPVVATRVRLPGIIGYLLGGLVIGPQVLGIVTATDTTVKALGQLGLLCLMFTADALAELAPVERATAQEDRTAWVAHEARPGDLVVLPAHPDWSTFGPAAVLASARPGISVVVVADPQRWSVASASVGALVADTPPDTRWP